jgi:lactoylglutathione lyase
VSTFNHVGICVSDLDRARHFYEALGFTVRNEMLDIPDQFTSKLLRVEPPVGLSAVYLQHDGFVLELLHYAGAGNPSPRERPLNELGLTHLSITVDGGDLTAACASVVEHGGEVVDDTNVGVAVLVRDPDGQVIELLSSLPF